MASNLRGPRVLGVLEKPLGVGLGLERGRVPHDSGHETGYGLDNDHRGELTPGQNVVTYGEFLVGEELGDTLVDALVPPADEDDVLAFGQAGHAMMAQQRPARGQQNHVAVLVPDLLDRAEVRFGSHDHPRPSPVGFVVDAAVFACLLYTSDA